jgi:hypothetical protein
MQAEEGKYMIKDNWHIWFSWWMSGIVCGLTIAQILVRDEELSCIILAITLGVLFVDIAVVSFVIWRRLR